MTYKDINIKQNQIQTLDLGYIILFRVANISFNFFLI